MKWLVAAAFLGNIAVFARAMRRFALPQGWPPAMRWLSACGAAGALASCWALVAVPASFGRQVLAVWLCVAAAWLFDSASKVAHRHGFPIAFSHAPPERLITEGVYARLHHPIYVSYALNWTGAVAGSASLVPIAVLTVMCAFYVVAAGSEDRELLHFRRDRTG